MTAWMCPFGLEELPRARICREGHRGHLWPARATSVVFRGLPECNGQGPTSSEGQ
jgi:hypothetical protein